MNEVKTPLASAAQSKVFTFLLKIYWSSENSPAACVLQIYVLQIAYWALLNSRGRKLPNYWRVFESSCLCTAPCALGRSDNALKGLCRVEKEEPVKLSSKSAPDPRRWRVLADPPLAAAKVGTVVTVPGGGSLLGRIPALLSTVGAVSKGSWDTFKVGCYKGCAAQCWHLSHSTFVSCGSIFFYFGILTLLFLPSFCEIAVFFPQISLQFLSGYCLALLFMHRPTTKKTMNQDLKYFQGVHPGYIKSTIFSESSFQSSDSLIWFTNRRYLRAFRKLAY